MRQILITLLFTVLSTTLLAQPQNHVLNLNGTSAYVDLPQTIINTKNFSLEAWVFMEGVGGGLWGQNFIFEQRSDDTGCNESAITFNAERRSGEAFSNFTVRSDADCGVTVWMDRQAYGEWHHYAAVLQGNTSSIYLDGILISSETEEHPGSFANNTTHVSLGKHTHDGEAWGFLFGKLDEVRIWNIPLTESQIQENMEISLTGAEAGLIAYWDFEGSSTTAIDQSDHGHNGELIDGAEIILEDEVIDPAECEDVNGDGLVDISDVIILINIILGN